MEIKVIYHSRSGNTRKVAEAMANAVGVPAEDVTHGLTGPVDLLFIGDGIYFGDMSKAMRVFIDGLDGQRVKRAAVFGTYGGQNKAVANMKERLAARGIGVMDETFACKGKAWWVMNRRHPDQDELDAAGAFARRIRKPHERIARVQGTAPCRMKTPIRRVCGRSASWNTKERNPPLKSTYQNYFLRMLPPRKGLTPTGRYLLNAGERRVLTLTVSEQRGGLEPIEVLNRGLWRSAVFRYVAKLPGNERDGMVDPLT